MKNLSAVPAILIFLLCTSANPSTISKNKLGSTHSACTRQFVVDNSGGVHTINHARIAWPGYSHDWFPTIGAGSIWNVMASNPGNEMHYPVTVTLWWSSPATAPVKLRLTANDGTVLIGNFTSNVNISTASVSGTNANGPGAAYCDGVTVEVTEGI